MKEYIITYVSINPEQLENSSRVLTDLAKQGWEIISANQNSQYPTLLFYTLERLVIPKQKEE